MIKWWTGIKKWGAGSIPDEYMKAFEEKLITPADKALWERGASNAGYHYLGCAKTFALMGKAFAEASNNFLSSTERKERK